MAQRTNDPPIPPESRVLFHLAPRFDQDGTLIGAQYRGDSPDGSETATMSLTPESAAFLVDAVYYALLQLFEGVTP